MKTTLPISKIVDEWLENCDVCIDSRKAYRKCFDHYWKWACVNCADKMDVKRSEVIRYKQQLETSGLSIYTVSNYLTGVKSFYRYCEHMNYHDNIAAGIRTRFRDDEYRKYPLTEAEVKALIKSIDGDRFIDLRDSLIVHLMLFNGLRRVEIIRMDIEDYDSANRTIRIQRKGSNEKKDMIRVLDNVQSLIDTYISIHPVMSNTGPLFVSESNRNNHNRLHPTTISIIVKTRLKAIGIDNPMISCHSLRHTCACMLLDHNVPMDQVQDTLGHTSINTTRLYTKISRKRKLMDHNPMNEIYNKMMLKNEIRKQPD